MCLFRADIWTAFCVVFVVAFQVAPTDGKCAMVKVVSKFNVNAYTGLWYEIRRFPVPFQQDGACVTAKYTPLTGTPLTVKVINRQINDRTSKVEEIEGVARLKDNSGEGNLLVKFPTSPMEGPYQVLDTDYINYSIVYSCREISGQTIESSWILSRTPILRKRWRTIINKVLERNGVNKHKYLKTRQGPTCVYQ